MFLCLKLKEICLYVLMSKTKRNMSLCSYVRNKKDYVFMSKVLSCNQNF